MIQTTHLAAGLAFAAGLTAAGVALAQTQQPASAAPAAASTQPAPADTTPPLVQSETPIFKPYDPDSSQPAYSVRPPDGSSGIYLPAVILGYGKSVAGCIVIGCKDGPQVDGSSASSSGSAETPPVNPDPTNRR